MPDNLIPPHAEILYESEGLTIHRNPKNKFVIATLFYFADPAKRRPEWARTVQASMTTRQWEKEYMISYTAQFGERVFPEIIEKRSAIVVPDMDFNSGQFWGGFDYGARNPSSFHVYTYMDGAFYAIWELYEPCKNIPEFAMKLKQCPYYHRLKYIAADPSIFDRRTHNALGQTESVANLFLKEGISKFVAGSTDESSWLAQVRKHWESDDPSFKISNACPQMIREFEQSIFEDYSNERSRELNNIKEGIQDKNNHALDDNKYFFNSQPFIRSGTTKKNKQDTAAKWMAWGGQARKQRGLSNGAPATFNDFTTRRLRKEGYQ